MTRAARFVPLILPFCALLVAPMPARSQEALPSPQRAEAAAAAAAGEDLFNRSQYAQAREQAARALSAYGLLTISAASAGRGTCSASSPT